MFANLLSSKKKTTPLDAATTASLVKQQSQLLPPTSKKSSIAHWLFSKHKAPKDDSTKADAASASAPRSTKPLKPVKSASKTKCRDIGGVPECCRRFVRAALASKSSPDSTFQRITYRYVDGSWIQTHSTTVGGHRVPFFTSQVATLRRLRPFNHVLAPIEEENDPRAAWPLCESCHSFEYSNQSRTACVTLTTIVRRASAIPDEDEPMPTAVVAKEAIV
ncbi:Aste57867_10793 [Aphanomyces stellatus]|uniref:Aste57867_10793 protein n=1 Tax=Aphanomyces stellatus TaxID=120398 RepID=A0A485KS05_9STRA|nr:hypothetical protein As57867_010753 [Aphanomyces stellatus]VFT87662.1 Aste57867_10793 [Aphanomyces stellatus]